MRVLRGRATSPSADHAVTTDLLERTASAGGPGLRVWYPPGHVAFGRRDRSAEGYDRAREAAAELGYPPVQRRVGGRAVAFTGDTLAFAVARPARADRAGIEDRYEDAVDTLARALTTLGVTPERGEPPGAFCPGTHSLSADGKLAGLAQRVRRDVAVVGGVVVVRDAAAVAHVLDPVYSAIGVDFDPAAVGSVAAAGGDVDPAAVRTTVEDAFVGDADPVVRTVGKTADSGARGG
jgi:lipoate-protein ligase A